MYGDKIGATGNGGQSPQNERIQDILKSNEARAAETMHRVYFVFVVAEAHLTHVEWEQSVKAPGAIPDVDPRISAFKDAIIKFRRSTGDLDFQAALKDPVARGRDKKFSAVLDVLKGVVDASLNLRNDLNKGFESNPIMLAASDLATAIGRETGPSTSPDVMDKIREIKALVPAVRQKT